MLVVGLIHRLIGHTTMTNRYATPWKISIVQPTYSMLNNISDKQPYKSKWGLKGLKLRIRLVRSPTKVLLEYIW